MLIGIVLRLLAVFILKSYKIGFIVENYKKYLFKW